ncbi:hypothetical protein F4818DRAFT_423716 [Hypoxylon cercidicola]|nr:hypothetical protein F4818DRAFT_423716 [Hypoxylon cercidicola]
MPRKISPHLSILELGIPAVEPLSFTASIIAVLQLAGIVAGACNSYIEGINDDPKDFLVISIEIETLKTLMKGLQLLKTLTLVNPRKKQDIT